MEAKKNVSVRDHQLAILEILREFDRVCKALEIPYMLFAGTMLGAVRHRGYIPWDDDLDVIMHRRDYERFLREAEPLLDTERFYLQKEYSEHFPMFFSKLRLNNTTCIEKYHPKDPQMHQGVYMDIFPCDSMLESEFGRRCQFYASKIVISKCLDRRGYDTDSWSKRMIMFLCRLLPMKPFLALTKAGRPDSTWVHSFLGGSRSYSNGIYPRSLFDDPVQMEFEGERYLVPGGYDAILRVVYGDYMVLPPEDQRRAKQHAVLVDLENSYETYTNYLDGMKFDIYTRSIR